MYVYLNSLTVTEQFAVFLPSQEVQHSLSYLFTLYCTWIIILVIFIDMRTYIEKVAVLYFSPPVTPCSWKKTGNTLCLHK